MVDESHWCEGDEGIAPHDPHEAVDAAHYECAQCRETVEPKLDPPGVHKTIPGTIEATGHGVTSDGQDITFVITPEEYETVTTTRPTSAEQQALIDAVPDERIISRSWSG